MNKRMLTTFAIAALIAAPWFRPVYGVEPAAAGVIDERAAMNRNTAYLAANLLIGQLRDSFAKKQIDCDLYKLMSGAPSKYIGAAAAEKSLAVDYAAKLSQSYRDEAVTVLDNIRERYNGGSDFYPPPLYAALLELPERYVQENLRSVFPGVYKSARERITTEQREKIVGSSFPTEVEVDSLSEDELIKQQEAKLLKDWNDNIFDENRSFVRSSIVKPLVAEALAQRRQQLKLLEDFKVSAAVLPGEYEKSMGDALAEMLERRRANPSERKTYNVFPSVAAMLPRRAKELTVEKFVSTVPGFLPEFSDDEIIDVTVKSPGLHRTAAESESIFYNLYRQKAMDAALTDFLAKAPEADRSDLRTFIENNAVGAAATTELLRNAFKNKVLPDLSRLRGLISRAQLKRYLPALDDGSWLAPDRQLEQLYHDRTLNFSKRWRELPGLEIDGGVTVFDETDALAATAAAAAFQTGLKAMDRQIEIVRRIYADILRGFASVRNDGSHDYTGAVAAVLGVSAAAKLSPESLFKAYSGKVAAEWEAQRIPFLWPTGSVRPESSLTAYKKLFPMVEAEIETRVRGIFSELEMALPEEYGPGSDIPDLKVINCNVELSLSASGYSAAVSSPQNPLMRRLFTLQSAPGGTGEYTADGIKKFKSDISEFLLEIIRSVPTDRKNLIQVFILVADGNIPYSTVDGLRDMVKETLRGLRLNGETRYRVADEMKRGIE
ncbi:MAG: hypothetical protein PHI85_02520 [Victivallaceae bacterium]|nr:hypothetical protein [Victivallaceae bacterium]